MPEAFECTPHIVREQMRKETALEERSMLARRDCVRRSDAEYEASCKTNTCAPDPVIVVDTELA